MNKCIVCDGKLHRVLDLGTMPSANNLTEKKDLNKVKSYPLKYYSCEECGLFQLTKFASSKTLFDKYLYLTGASPSLVEHFREMSDYLAKEAKHTELAYAIASNDGTEIKLLKDAGFKKVVGIDPSSAADIANEKGLFTVKAFFDLNLARKLASDTGKADLIVANNVFAHIPDPKGMLKGMAALVKPDGIISIEIHWMKSIVDKVEFETLYAEHYFVWSIRAMEKVAKMSGLEIKDVLYMPDQHGGSLRCILQKENADMNKSKVKSYTKLENMEIKSKIYDIAYLKKNLQKRVNERRRKLVKLIKEIKKKNKVISIWSVPAKVPTLLNFCGITNKEITCAYEVAPTKIGKWIPKARIEIKDQDKIMQDMPDYLLVGAWNYWNFANKKFEPYMRKGGKLINPLTMEIR